MPCDEKQRPDRILGTAKALSRAVEDMYKLRGNADALTQAKAVVEERQRDADAAVAGLDKHTDERGC